MSKTRFEHATRYAIPEACVQSPSGLTLGCTMISVDDPFLILEMANFRSSATKCCDKKICNNTLKIIEGTRTDTTFARAVLNKIRKETIYFNESKTVTMKARKTMNIKDAKCKDCLDARFTVSITVIMSVVSSWTLIPSKRLRWIRATRLPLKTVTYLMMNE